MINKTIKSQALQILNPKTKKKKIKRENSKNEEIRKETKERPLSNETKQKPPPIETLTSFDDDFTGTSNSKARNGRQKYFYEALNSCTADQVHFNRAELASLIEEEIYKKYSGTGKEYQQKFRTLFSNLKDPKNQQLRDNLFSGYLNVEQLLDMSHTDLANPELQEKRKKIRDWNTQARMEQRTLATCTAWVCKRCNGNLTSYYTLQIRSADEPMTAFITCQNCKHQWKIN